MPSWDKVGVYYPNEKTYLVRLDEAARTKLTKMLNGGKWPARSLKCARALLLADVSTLTDGQLPATDEQVASMAGCGRNTVQRLRQRFCEEGLDAALAEKTRPVKRVYSILLRNSV